MKDWEKTKFSRVSVLDGCMIDKDFENEFLLNEKMKELMLDDQETSELDEEYKEQEESENDTRDDVDTTVIIIKKKTTKLLISL